MLQDFNDVVSRVGALLGDPQNIVFTATYLAPYIDQEYDEMDVSLERIGMQYVEGIAIFTIDAGVTDLTPYLADGQPLATMKYPKGIRWKLPGQPDTSYLQSELVTELDEASVSSFGALQYRFADGAIQVTPSSTSVVLKVYFDQISTQLVDNTGTVIRGTAHILALRVAEFVYGLRGNDKMVLKIHKKSVSAWMDFKVAVSMANQGKTTVAPAMHPSYLTSTTIIPAPTS